MATIEPLAPTELEPALSWLLAAPGHAQLATRSHVLGFRDYVRDSTLGWEGLRCGPAQCPAALFLALLLHGRTALVMIPAPGLHGIDRPTQLQLTLAGLDALRHHRLHYAQALIEPRAAAKRDLLAQAGFTPLAPLLYLERDTRYPWIDPPQADAAEWVHYSPANRDQFAAVIEATYQDSLDCPELAQLRSMDDALASHERGGSFEHELWEIARIGGQPAGCILLGPLGNESGIEIIYMGVAPASRRRGVGSLLLRRALAQCRSRGRYRLTVVADERNHPAIRLYERHAFQPIAVRDAHLYVWK